MNKEILIETVSRLITPPKGILAIDESLETCNKRFEKLGIPTTEENRQKYRELLVTTPEIENYVSGYITFDETIRQSTKDGRSFISVLKSKGIDVGIKVDKGTKDFVLHQGEKITEGLDGLADRLQEYKEMGATFAKWRAVYSISDTTPSQDLMKENAHSLALYASLCQENDIVPVVEPEVLVDGTHSIEKSYEVISYNLDVLFSELRLANVFIPGTILKTSMVLSGKDAANRADPARVAEMTVKCLKEHVPADIGGIVFLSGGQSEEEAILNLNAMHQMGKLPWPLTFSYGRAIQNPALESFAKNTSDFATAQSLLLERARLNSLASVGQYK